MSGAEQVQSFNPFIALIWLTNLVVLLWDWQSDGAVTWSIPVIGSFVIIQLYMIWKTNYDEMMEKQRDAQARALGGPIDTPEITPGQTKLKDLYQSRDKKKSQPQKKSSSGMINLNSQPAEDDK